MFCIVNSLRKFGSKAGQAAEVSESRRANELQKAQHALFARRGFTQVLKETGKHGGNGNIQCEREEGPKLIGLTRK